MPSRTAIHAASLLACCALLTSCAAHRPTPAAIDLPVRQPCVLPADLDQPGEDAVLLVDGVPMPLEEALKAWGEDRQRLYISNTRIDVIRDYVKGACQ